LPPLAGAVKKSYHVIHEDDRTVHRIIVAVVGMYGGLHDLPSRPSKKHRQRPSPQTDDDLYQMPQRRPLQNGRMRQRLLRVPSDRQNRRGAGRRTRRDPRMPRLPHEAQNGNSTRHGTSGADGHAYLAGFFKALGVLLNPC